LIDLHSHIIADEASTEKSAVDWAGVINIARMALEDGIEHVVWSPEYHIGQIGDDDVGKNEALLYTANLKLQEIGFPLALTLGADFHISSNECLSVCAEIAKVSKTRYVLLSFSHAYFPHHFEVIVRELLAKGYIPILAHPERLSWINEKYHIIRSLVNDGVWIQITADSFTGYFGRKAQYWAERFMTEGIIHVIASEAHTVYERPPVLSEAKQILGQTLSAVEVNNIMSIRPQKVLSNGECEVDLLPPGVNHGWQVEKVS